jgi:glycosyltransferase involved in cell wall biosynthesis
MNKDFVSENNADTLTIIVPTFNEQKSVAKTAAKLIEFSKSYKESIEIIFVDDGSTDNSYNELARFEGIRIIRHSTNKGYGAALKTGILASRSNWIAITDADSTYPIDRIQDLLEMAQKNDLAMAVGARTGSNVNVPLIRKPAKWFIIKLACILSGRSVPDLNSGLRVFRREIAKEFLEIFPDGFSFTSTITMALISNGYAVEYLPIDYHKRTGKSKIRPIYDTLNFIQLIIRLIMYFNPLRVFIPASLALFLLSLLAIIYRFFYGGLAVVSLVFFIAGIQMLSIGMIADLIDQRIRLTKYVRRD